MGVGDNDPGLMEDELLDAALDDNHKWRATFDWLAKSKKVVNIATLLACTYNIFLPSLFFWSNVTANGTVSTFTLGLGLCMAATLIGVFVGAVLALFPLKDLPYYLKLPLATLSGILLSNLALACFATLRFLTLPLSWPLGQ